MHVLYIHQNYPAQFGHIARHLARRDGWRCTFVSQRPAGVEDGIERIQYQVAGGATTRNHYCSRTFENTIWHCDGVYQALKTRRDIRPDLIVGHSGFGSTLFLREWFGDVPILNFFEYFYRPHSPESDMDFRADLGWSCDAMTYARARCRNAMILLDLDNCDGGYTPTEFQRSRFPAEYLHKMRVLFDGIDREIYHGFDQALRPPLQQRATRTIAGVPIGPSTRLVSYVSRGFESMRGFDIFMRSAQRIIEQFPDVHFIVVGEDKVAYGGDSAHLQGQNSFKQWVLAQGQYDLSKFSFVGRLAQPELAQLLASCDLHLYFTVPFVLSWSMMDAMSCGAVVLASDTAPVREMIRDGENGLLADFFNIDQIAQKAVAVLKAPDAYRPLGNAAEEMIRSRYSLQCLLPQMVTMYEQIAARRPRNPGPAGIDAPPPMALGDNKISPEPPQATPGGPKSPFFG